jgi:hypothetical protein
MQWRAFVPVSHTDVMLAAGSPQNIDTLRLKFDVTSAETTFHLSAKWTIPLKLAGASVQPSCTHQW